MNSRTITAPSIQSQPSWRRTAARLAVHVADFPGLFRGAPALLRRGVIWRRGRYNLTQVTVRCNKAAGGSLPGARHTGGRNPA